MTIGIKGEELSGILITHEHSDHIQGLGVLSAESTGCRSTPPEGRWKELSPTEVLGEMPEGSAPRAHGRMWISYLGDLTVKPFCYIPRRRRARRHTGSQNGRKDSGSGHGHGTYTDAYTSRASEGAGRGACWRPTTMCGCWRWGPIPYLFKEENPGGSRASLQ